MGQVSHRDLVLADAGRGHQVYAEQLRYKEDGRGMGAMQSAVQVSIRGLGADGRARPAAIERRSPWGVACHVAFAA